MIVLETERLILSHAGDDDAAFFLKLLTDDSFIQNIGDKGVKNEEDAKGYINESLVKSYQTNGFGLYLTTLKATGEPVGICGLVKRDSLDCPDVGYAFLPEYSGKGYATESALAVMDYSKTQLHIPRVVGITSKDNIPSQRVLEKLGLKFEKMVPYNDTEESMLFVP